MCQVALLREKSIIITFQRRVFHALSVLVLCGVDRMAVIAYNLSPQASVNSFKAISSKSDLNMNKM